jgi:ribosome-interacting GTPase 1
MATVLHLVGIIIPFTSGTSSLARSSLLSMLSKSSHLAGARDFETLTNRSSVLDYYIIVQGITEHKVGHNRLHQFLS